MSTKETATTREILVHMLESLPAVQKTDAAYAPDETIGLELLLKAGGGSPAPMAKIERLVLGEDFLTIHTSESTTLLPYGVVVGLRVVPREKSRGAGFLR